MNSIGAFAAYRQVRVALRGMLDGVSHAMRERPILSNSVVCLKLWVAGDLLAQSYTSTAATTAATTATSKSAMTHQIHEQQQQQQHEVVDDDDDDDDANSSGSGWSWNWTRTAYTGLYGATINGPLYALWYPFLDRQCRVWKVATWFGGHSVWAVPVTKVVLDEVVMDPPAISIFFVYMDICQNDFTVDLESIQHKLVKEVPRAWVTSLLLWPAVLLGTFRFVPVHFQTAVVNSFAVVWDGYLAYRNGEATAMKRRHDQQQQQQQADGKEEPQQKQRTEQETEEGTLELDFEKTS